MCSLCQERYLCIVHSCMLFYFLQPVIIYIFCFLKQNHPAERIWVEVNQRVNYPTKQALNALIEVDQLNMDDPIVRFCLSWLTMRVCQVGIKCCVLAWNNHFIPSMRFRMLRIH